MEIPSAHRASPHNMSLRLRLGVSGLFLAALETCGQRDTGFRGQIVNLNEIRDGDEITAEVKKLRR